MSITVYQSDAEAALRLSADERLAANQLKVLRPEVHPGTRAILDHAKAVQWFDKVTQTMLTFGMHSDPNMDRATAFCDLAGVPD